MSLTIGNAIGIGAIVIACGFFAIGLRTAYRNGRGVGVAYVPTMPWGIACPLLAVIGCADLRTGLPWWVFPLAFLGLSVLSVWSLLLVERAGRRRRRRA
jgi:hypothetical protein